MNDCDFCGEHTLDCRCAEPCPKCGYECSCESDAETRMVLFLDGAPGHLSEAIALLKAQETNDEG